MAKYKLRWGQVFSRREEERARREPSRERGRSLERSPRRPAFCADRVPVARDQRAEGRPRVGAYAVSADRDAGQRERDRGDSGHGSDERRAVGEFRSPEGRGRRRDERGRWRGLERFNADRAREAAHGEEPWETSSEEEAEEAGAHLERAAEDADGGDDKEEPVTGIGNAEPGAAEVVGSASQVGGSQSGRREWRERDASHQEEQSAEGLRRQERREWGVRVGATSSGTQGERSRSDMGGLRVAREEPRRWERQPVNPRALDGRRAQKGGSLLAAGRGTRGRAQFGGKARPAARGAKQGGVDSRPAGAVGEEDGQGISLAARQAAAGKGRWRRRTRVRGLAAAGEGRSLVAIAREVAAAGDKRGMMGGVLESRPHECEDARMRRGAEGKLTGMRAGAGDGERVERVEEA
ncbi:unnamed protein product [Closterium sp. NIES-65]|nr:unnamed protein product [Closterium sp. NIES-65]